MNLEDNKDWSSLVEAKKKVDIYTYRIRQLSIEQQISILEKAFKEGQEKEALIFIRTVEPIGFANSNRLLTKGLLDMIVSIATFPGNNESDAMLLLLELLKYHPQDSYVIERLEKKYLDEADISLDYEVYIRVGELFSHIDKNLFDSFLLRLRIVLVLKSTMWLSYLNRV